MPNIETQIITNPPVTNGQNQNKRKYIRKPTKDDPTRPRVIRRTRNTSKSVTNTVLSQTEQSTMDTKKTPTSPMSPAQTMTKRTGSTTANADLGQISVVGTNGRQLPPKEGINQENIADRFVEFIMYCNPSAPGTLDTAALIRSFNAVPKSDGKVFQTWSLYQLVGKHYSGEIRTWTKLAQKLGVVRTPEASPQKIQQYAVRLKKWMASVHVDAYFDYLLSRSNEYYQMPQKNPIEASDDESDVVLKLIKRAGSKRQKRKYTRKSTNTSGDGTANEDASRGIDNVELDDDVHFESEEVDEGVDSKHRIKRSKHSYSDDNEGSEEEDDKDPWAIGYDEEKSERPVETTGTGQRRKNVVQVGFGPRWVKDEAEEEVENIVGGRLGVNKEGNPENDSSRYYRQYPSQFASNFLPHLIEPNKGSNIPTPNPSPTLPDMNLSSGNDAGIKRVLSHSGATSGAGTQKLRWRSISVGGGPVPTGFKSSAAAQSYLTTSSNVPSSSQKEQKKKQDAGQSVNAPTMARQISWTNSGGSIPAMPSGNNIANIPNEQQQSTGDQNFANMFLPTSIPSNDDGETIKVLQEKLVRAVGMLEDSQRKIKMYENLVRKRDEDVRQRVIQEIKNDVNGVFERWQQRQ
ncbi:9736_t:CDS:2 [Funneliformis mosseae]|uniref:9736_t:CDS:1 n=1 Tax=Funneliformis mosseae TaxID=27381 RepID=A0A9N9AMJ3_FUNMO|nr:9736_t:CDS:2 [Funneliformis mosseae]